MGIFDFVTGYGGPLEGQSGGGLGGLFDPQDPRKAGLLSAAFGLLGQQGFGNAGLLGMQASQQARSRALQEKRQSLQDELVKNQLDQQKRQKYLDDLAPQYLKTIRPDMMDDRDVGLPGEAPVTPQMDLQGLAQAYLGAPGGLDRGIQLQQALRREQPQPIKLGANERLLEPGTNRVLVDAQPDQAKTNAFVQLMREAGIDPASPEGKKLLAQRLAKEATHSPPVNVSYGQPIAGVDAAGNPVFFQQPKGGGAPVIVPGVRPSLKADKDLTDAQAKANLFGTRAQEADKVIGDLATKGTVSPSIAQQMSNPSGITGRIATAMATPQQQQIDQAQRDFINAVLRRESGAVIADSEFANARLQYFPQPGDSPQVIAQKARNRKIATEGILAEVPPARRGVPTANTPAETFSDADKERRYQEWKARQK